MLAVHMVFVLLVTSQHILSEAFSSSESPCERAVYGGGVNDNSATPQTSYEEAAQNKPFTCFDCTVKEHGPRCGDPFNYAKAYEKTNPLPMVTCTTSCVKWVRRPELDGNITDIVRTCKNFLDIHMYTVPGSCLTERVSGNGWLCLCRDWVAYHPCNRALSKQEHAGLTVTILLLFAQYIVF